MQWELHKVIILGGGIEGGDILQTDSHSPEEKSCLK